MPPPLRRRAHCEADFGWRKSSSSPAGRPAMPKVLSATAPAILRYIRPRPSRWWARLRERN